MSACQLWLMLYSAQYRTWEPGGRRKGRNAWPTIPELPRIPALP